MGRTHVDHGSELGEREVFVEILLDVVGNSPQSGSWQRGPSALVASVVIASSRSTTPLGRPGVVLPDASDEGRVFAKMLWRLHPRASFVIVLA
jgi:hypothetical protein